MGHMDIAENRTEKGTDPTVGRVLEPYRLTDLTVRGPKESKSESQDEDRRPNAERKHRKHRRD
jgi:hypothetical protein